ncbi:MAG: MBOAT family protein [Ruminococcaceae bacterium]|nr:MBOAT family protein [Oscillospiraceae bacterium]
MLFNSLAFLAFFFVVTVFYYAVPEKFKWPVLLISSIVFYAFFTPLHIIILLAVTAISYVIGRLVYNGKEKTKKPKGLIALGVILCFSFLFTYKYLTFFTTAVYGLLHALHIPFTEAAFELALPVGISFFTFKAVSYMVDAYRGKIVEKNFFKYLLYVSFFPQIASGPIERSTNFLPELTKAHKFDKNNIESGLYLMMFGLFKKMVVADNLSVVVNQVFGEPENYSPPVLLGVACVYSVQILCDFSGYSDIAVGCARVFGINTADNFNHPYFAESIAVFWRKWHISLSSWFRDYLYIPLGGNRKGTARKYINLMIVFLVSGLWHGSAWNFVLWGFLHGIYQIVGAVTQPARDKLYGLIHLDRHEKLHRSLRITITFLLVTFAWIFFRASTISDGFDYVKCMLFNPGRALSAAGIIAEFKLVFSVKNKLFAFLIAMFSFVVYSVIDYKKDVFLRIKDKHTAVKMVFYVLFIVFVVMFASTSVADFIYLRF